ncbi:MAG: adenylate/guanylate cyclase domain-containing protein, partial [bacterium]
MHGEIEKYPLWREEKRPVSVLFADLCGYSEMCTRMDIEIVGKRLKEIHQEISGIVNRHGGVVPKIVGDCLMGIFGAPVSSGEEIARAGFCALEIKKWGETKGKQIYQIPGIKIGLNHGIVLTTVIEAGFITDFTILGETVNIADQLYRFAKPGQILCPSHLAEKMEPGFYLEFREMITQKGTGKLLGVYEVLRAKRGDEQFPLQPLIGRKPELAFCETILNKSLSQKGQIIGVLGAEGTGKKTFAAYVLNMARKKGFITSSITCYAFRRNLPFWVISQLVAGLLDKEDVAKKFSPREYEIMKNYILRAEPPVEEVIEGQELKALLFSIAKKALLSVAEEKPLFL